MTAMELIEELKKLDPTTVITIEKEDNILGWHYEPIKETDFKIVRMKTLNVIGRKPTRKLLSCSIEKPNSFVVCVLR